MRKILLSVVFALLAISTAMAIPAKRVWRTVSQPDGTTLKLMLVGDERLHYFVTDDNVPVMEYNDAYYYADGVGFGMKRSNILAHEASQRTALETATARTSSVKRIEAQRPFTLTKLFAPTHRVGESSDGFTSDHRLIAGKHKSIVILVNFPERNFQSSHDSTYYWDMVNEVGYTNAQGAIGSIHDYFYDQSAGKLDLTFDVVGPVTTDNSERSYVQDTWAFAYEVLNKVHAKYPNLNWADYDWNGDGEVENLYIIYAGYGAATGGSQSTTIWPAQTNFDDYNAYAQQQGMQTYNVNFDGIKINTFAYGNELYGNSYYNMKPQGMGTMTHEFSHCLGFPDLYITDYSDDNRDGMGDWSILASGSYGGPNGIGWVPTGYTAYEKWAAGWIDYKDFATQNDTITGLRSTYNGGDAYVIYNDARPMKSGDQAEYFLFENRTKNRWDTYLPAQGLEVLHVNYERSVWANNAVNTPKSGNGNYNMVPVYADDNSNSNTERYDLYPYQSKDSITSNSSPNLAFFYAQNDGTRVFPKSIINIAWNSADSTVSFIYNPVNPEFTPEPTISGDDYFVDSALVTITAPMGNIRYSTDSLTWYDYTEPIYLKGDTVKVYAYAWRADGNDSKVVSKTFIRAIKIENPVITGDTIFTTNTRVTITGRGQIYYSLSTSNTSRFQRYTRPLRLAESTVVRAFCTTTNKAYANSDTVSVAFRKIEVCAEPTFEANADSTEIIITTNTDSATTYWSADSISFAEYTDPIAVTSDTTTIWAYTARDGYANSPVVKYTLIVPKKSVDAINSIIAAIEDGRSRVYTIDGQYVAIDGRRGFASLRPGVYIIVDDNGNTRKIALRH